MAITGCFGVGGRPRIAICGDGGFEPSVRVTPHGGSKPLVSPLTHVSTAASAGYRGGSARVQPSGVTLRSSRSHFFVAGA